MLKQRERAETADEVAPGFPRTERSITRRDDVGNPVAAAYLHRIDMEVDAKRLMGLLAYIDSRLSILESVLPKEGCGVRLVRGFKHATEEKEEFGYITFFPTNEGFMTIGLVDYPVRFDEAMIKNVDLTAKAVCGMLNREYVEPTSNG